MTARTRLGHLSSPCWLLPFVYPQTSWMLMADSPLVYTSGRRIKTAHCFWEPAPQCKGGRGGVRYPGNHGKSAEWITERPRDIYHGEVISSSSTGLKWNKGLESTWGPGSWRGGTFRELHTVKTPTAVQKGVYGVALQVDRKAEAG